MTELEHALRELGRALELPPAPDVAGRVAARIGPRRRLPVRRIALALAAIAVAVGVAFAVPPARSERRTRRPAARRRLRASLATIRSTQGRKGASGRKRPSARHALTKASWAASSASAALPAMTYATLNATSWCDRTSSS